MAEPAVKTTVEIDDRLLRRAKRYAAQQGTTLRAIIEDALRARLPVHRDQRSARRFSPPVVQGSSPPSFDVADRNALFDALDAGS